MRNDYFDSIEDEIQIKASPAKVWEWISTPGWWINDGVISVHQTLETGGQLLVRNPKYGGFLIQVLETTPEKSVVYRWSCNQNQPNTEAIYTQIRFLIDENAEGCSLKVIESGFLENQVAPEIIRENYLENKHGWSVMLNLLKATIEETN